MMPPVGKSGPVTMRKSCRRRSSRVVARSPASAEAVGAAWPSARPAGLLLFLDDVDDPVDDLGEVVRRDVGRHAHGDARRAVHQQVRDRRRQDRRFFGGLVVVGDEVDRLLLQVGHQVVGQALKARLGVAHRRRHVAVDRSEVPLAVHQGIAHVEFLREADQRVVDRGVAVRMEVAHHLADDLGALAVAAIARQAHVPHAVQHAAVRRLEAIADVRQRSPDDHAHRVIHVRALHLVFDVDGDLVSGEFHRYQCFGIQSYEDTGLRARRGHVIGLRPGAR